MEYFEQPVLKSLTEDRAGEGDYVDPDTGLLMCGKCHTKKQHRLPFKIGSLEIVNLRCACERAEAEAMERRMEQKARAAASARLRGEGMADPAYHSRRFGRDDMRNARVTEYCKRYVEKWDKMAENNIGMLFYGPVGTGKSFYACAIANALIDRGVSAVVTSLPKIIAEMQDRSASARALTERIRDCGLLVIDDLGAERNTAFALECAYDVVDGRSRSGKPLIVTTNLTRSELANPPDLKYGRVYDRVLEMCPLHIRLDGESRRPSNARDKRALAKELLGGEGIG